MNNNRNSETDNTLTEAAELRAKRNRQCQMILVIGLYAINMVIGSYFMFTNQHKDALTHTMLANMSSLFIIDQAYSNNK